MSNPKKRKLDIHRSSVDIISELIGRQLEHVVEDILSNLSEIDIANAVTANPKWSAIITSRTRLKRLLSRNNETTAPLKTFYQREVMLAHQTQDSSDIRSLFLKACVKCSNLAIKSRVNSAKKQEEQEDFRIVFPLDDTFFWKFKTIHVTDRFIVTLLKGSSTQSLIGSRSRRYYHLVQLFDRWTFELVTSMTVYCNDLNLHFIETDINAVVIDRTVDGIRGALLWDFTTGKLHTLHCPAPIFQSFCVDKLIVLVWRDGEEHFATVFKVHTNSNSFVTCIVDCEPLHARGFVWKLQSTEDLDCFAIYALQDRSSVNVVFQVRSKEDFTLLQLEKSIVWRARGFNSVLLCECLTIVFKEGPSVSGPSVDVLSLHDDFRTVYRFAVPTEMDRVIELGKGDVATVGGFLILYLEYGDALNVAIWKLPSDFIETCHRHLNERTVGVTSECDQLIVEKSSEKCDEMPDHEAHGRFDRFGVLKCSVYSESCYLETPAVVRVSMLSSIISDEESI